MMLATERSVIYPAVLIKLNNITCRALLGTGDGISYTLLAFLEKLKTKPIRKKTKRIEIMMHSTVGTIDVFEVEIKDISGSFQFKSEKSKVEKETLLSLPNPNYEAVLKQHQHLWNITMNDMNKKKELPTYLVFGASGYTKIKVQVMLRVR